MAPVNLSSRLCDAPLTGFASATPTAAPAAPHVQFPAIRYPATPASAALVTASEDLGLHL